MKLNIWSQEWDQERASRRSLEEMRRIAAEVEPFLDDDTSELERYARQNELTINEIVYYANAYEYGGDEGLAAIRNPDIIPEDVARRAVRLIAKDVGNFLAPYNTCRVTDEGTAIGLYQVQTRMNGERYLFAICQFRLTLESAHWHLYWMRKFEAWWPYPAPSRGHRFSLSARLKQVFEDEDGCFWG
jgi:hypothetical protein